MRDITCLLAGTLLLTTCNTPGRATEPPELPLSRAYLAGFGLPTDDKGLLEVLKDRMAPLERIPGLIRQLGDKQFPKRQAATQRLIALADLAVAALKTASQDADPELSRRATYCLKQIGPPTISHWLYTVINVLGQHKPPATFDTFLAFLPHAQDPLIEEEIYYTLDEFAATGGRFLQALEAALTDGESNRRAAAACILARRANAATKRKVQQLLSDPAPYVRLRAAHGLLTNKDGTGIPTLIELLRSAEIRISWQAEELLRYVGEDKSPSVFVGKATQAECATCQAAWRKWFEKYGRTVVLADRHTRQGRPCVLLVFTTDQSGAQLHIATTGSDGIWRYQLTTARRIVDWVPYRGYVAWAQSGQMEFIGLAGMVSSQIPVPISKLGGIGYLGRLPGGHLVGVGRHLSEIIEFDSKGLIVRYYMGGVPSSINNGYLSPTGRLYALDTPREKAPAITELHPIMGSRELLNVVSRDQLEWRRTRLLCGLRDDGFLLCAAEKDAIYNVDSKGRIRQTISARGRVLSSLDGGVVAILPLRNGNTLRLSRSPTSCWIEERNPDDCTVWEVFPQDSRAKASPYRLVDLFPLLRFGFDKGSSVESPAERIKMLHCPAALKRWHAMESLGRMPFSDATKAAAGQALRDSDERVREAAILYLGRAQCKDLAAEIVSAMLSVKPLLGPHRYNEKAIQALGADLVVPLVVAAHEQAVKSNKDNDRLYPVKILAYCFPGSKKAREVVKAALRDRSELIRRAAFKSIPWHDKAALYYLPDMIKVIESPDPAWAQHGLWACWYTAGQHGFLGKEVLKNVLRAMGRKELLTPAVRCLGLLGRGQPTVIPTLVACLNSRESADVISAACTALGQLGPEAKGTVKALVEVAQGRRGGNSISRQSAVEALGAIGPSAREAIPLLTSLVRQNGLDDNPNMLPAVLAALRSIDAREIERLTGQRKK